MEKINTIEMVKLDDDTYVPAEWCAMTNPATSGGKCEIDDMDMLCGGDCNGNCSDCIIQRIFNAYTVLSGQLI